MAESKTKTSFESFREWVVDHKLRAVGCLWVSGIAGSIAYNWSQPGMKTSVKIIHASSSTSPPTTCLFTSRAYVDRFGEFENKS
ncbi:unnamed protein product [Ilex paraguariensis]|uniref:HIG1 domain-containing protein n=1 Tax=Ilex paraguariensis TaxID=185542 RepID=A0ABC8RJ43_9AQUA